MENNVGSIMKEVFVPVRVRFVSKVWKFDSVAVYSAAGLARTCEEAEQDDRVKAVVVEELVRA